MSGAVNSYLTEMRRLAEQETDEAAPVRRALQSILHEVVERVWEGDPEAAAHLLEKLDVVMPRVREILSSVREPPLVEASRYTHFVMQALQVVDGALEVARAVQTMLRSELDSVVLHALWEHGDSYLGRDEVRELSGQSSSIDVGAALDRLHAAGLATRVVLTVHGEPTVRYQLAPAASGACARMWRRRLTDDAVEDTH